MKSKKPRLKTKDKKVKFSFSLSPEAAGLLKQFGTPNLSRTIESLVMWEFREKHLRI